MSIRNESVKSFVNYYAPQVKIYSRFWEEITNQLGIKISEHKMLRSIARNIIVLFI